MNREHEEYLCALSDFERMGKEATDPAKKASYERICAEIRAKLWPPQEQQPQAITREELGHYLTALWDNDLCELVADLILLLGYEVHLSAADAATIRPLAAPTTVETDRGTIRVTPRPDGPPRLEIGEAR